MIKDFHEFILRDMGTSLAFCDDQEGCGKGREVREGGDDLHCCYSRNQHNIVKCF